MNQAPCFYAQLRGPEHFYLEAVLRAPSMMKAVLTDSHSWVPVLVLMLGCLLLSWVH
jgi:hypothetical protein